MTRISDEIRRKVIRAYIPDGRTITGFVAGCGISEAALTG